MKALPLNPLALLVVNLVLGILLAISNAGAVLVTVGGGRSHLQGQLAEAAAWAAAGVVIAVASVWGMRTKRQQASLGVQGAVIGALSVALAVNGIAWATGRFIPTAASVWVPGLVSAIAIYALLVASGPISHSKNKALLWLAGSAVIALILIDIGVYASLPPR